jgi:hypothetical protein
MLTEHLYEDLDLGVEVPVDGNHAGKLDQQQVQQVVLLALPLPLGVVAAGVGAHGREQQLVLDRHMGGQGGGDGTKGLVRRAWLPSAAS